MGGVLLRGLVGNSNALKEYASKVNFGGGGQSIQKAHETVTDSADKQKGTREMKHVLEFRGPSLQQTMLIQKILRPALANICVSDSTIFSYIHVNIDTFSSTWLGCAQ